MKKLLWILLSFLLIVNPCFATNQWREDGSEQTIVGTESPSDIDQESNDNIVLPFDRLLYAFRQGYRLVYASASTLTIESGAAVISNSAATARLMVADTSSTTLTWSDIDTGSEASSTTYYVYVGTSTTTDLTGTFYISTSSSTPTGVTYYLRLGYFYNDSRGNISRIVNDGFYQGLGTWASKSDDTIYQATTDGFVISYAKWDGSGEINYLFETDSKSTPTTDRARQVWGVGSVTTVTRLCLMGVVKAGDYYKVSTTNLSSVSVYWLPLN